MTRAVVTLAVAALAAVPAKAAAPELFERAVLPTTGALPTCACAVPQREGDELVVGLADGSVVSFHEAAGSVIPRSFRLPGVGPVDDIVACRVGRAAGSPNEFALVVVRGNELFTAGFSDLSVAGRLPLPEPAGRYSLARAAGCEAEAFVTSSDHPVIYDADSAMRITVNARTLEPCVEPLLDPAPGLSVTALSDRVVLVAGSRILEVTADGGTRTQLDERTDLADEPLRVAVASWTPGERTLELLASDTDSVWVTRTVLAPAPISVVASVSDSLIAVGGTRALSPEYDVGWLALVGPDGLVVAAGDHPSPVTDITRVSGFIAAQGEGRNLSVYGPDLEPLWDHDSPVSDAVLVAGDFVSDDSHGLAVVGTREYAVSAADADSIRVCLNMPGFMAGAERDGNAYRLRRSFITFYVSNEDRLRRTLTESGARAADAFEEGRAEDAAALATEARAAAAVLGERDRVAGLSARIHEYASFAARRRSMLLAALVLAVLGAWVAVECARRTTGLPTTLAATVLLLAAGAWAWKLVGSAGLNPVLLAGGVVAGASAVRSRLTVRPARRVPGAAIEDLIRVLMEFLHGAGEGVPSDGVMDTARKTVTKVAYLAQEMVDSIDDEDRYAMLRDRLRSRGTSFLDTTYPRVAVLLSLARRVGFISHEAERMSAAADRMRVAIATILSETAPDAHMLKHQLQTIKEGRDELAASADRAWAIVQSNPGCSLTRSVDRILEEKTEELSEAGVRASAKHGVPSERDAISLWSFEFRFILENLVTNALRAMRDSSERTLTIETATDGETCSVRVSDTGAGMDESAARSLFDPKDDERDGGFGLSNSRLRLRERGGDLVDDRTSAGPGTTFLLTIPHWRPDNGDTDA